jgi:putative endonuclease
LTKTTTGKVSYHAGQAAEFQVARHYERDGWHVLQHRFKNAAGEIDLVLRRNDTVLFVEVKRARTHDIAASRISLQQIARISQSAEIFVAEHLSGQNFEMRLDAALVDQKGEIQIIPNALAGF